MIQIYTSTKAVEDLGKKVIKLNDATFERYIKAQTLDKTDLKLMKVIEDVEVIDTDIAKCRGKFGYMNLNNISTGLKTILNIRYLLKHRKTNVSVDVTETGPNVLKYIFQLVDNTPIILILRHREVVGLPDHEYLINGKIRCSTSLDLAVELMECKFD